MTPQAQVNTVSNQMIPVVAPSQAMTQPPVETVPHSALITAGIAVFFAVMASVATHQVSQNPFSPWLIWLAVFVGGLGGLTHEIAQSRGKILFFQRQADGFYLGSVAGMILGAFAGLLAARGSIIDPSVLKTAAQPGPIPLIFEVFTAGLALKGVAEAAGGQAVPPLNSLPNVPLPNTPGANPGIGAATSPATLPPGPGH